MSIASIQSALAQAFQDGAFNLPTVYENTDGYESQTDTAWCEYLFIPNEAEPVTLGDTGEDEFTGVVRILLNYPLNSGIGETLEKADELKAYFKPGRDFTYNGQAVQVTRSSVDRGSNQNGFYQSPFTISWRATAQR